MKYILQHIKYLIIHKYYVFIECCKLGIPIRGLLHDLSKLLPDEFFPYTDNFFNKNKMGKISTLNKFLKARLKHFNRNPHHWQYWIEPGINNIVHDIPEKYLKEIIADWIGAGKTKKQYNFWEWYIKNKNNIILSPTSRKYIEERLKQIWKKQNQQ